MQMHIRHETRYRYERPVKYSVQSLHLTPRRDPSQRALTWSISAPGRRLEQVDAYGNISHLLTIEEPHREITIMVHGVVETADAEGRQDDGPLSPLAYLAPTKLTTPNEDLRAFARQALDKLNEPRARAQALANAVFDAVKYKSGRYGCGRVQERRRRVSGPRPRLHRLRALRRYSGALRERLPLHR
jgi:transglutaminase-like putative cysteine protease